VRRYGWACLWALIVLSVMVFGYACWYAVDRATLGRRLLAAAESGDCGQARALLERGAYVGFAAPLGSVGNGNPLTAAAYAHHPDMIRLLVASGADPNSGGATGSPLVGEEGGPPLYVASWRDADPGGGETVRALLDCGADPCYRPDPLVPSPLEEAAMHAAREQVRALLDAGAPADARSPQGRTPLMLACVSGAIHAEHTDPGRVADVVRMFLEAGADPNAPGPQERTALHCAADSGSRSAVGELLAWGADPSLRDCYGATPLDIANRNRYFHVSLLLREHGAKTSVELRRESGAEGEP